VGAAREPERVGRETVPERGPVAVPDAVAVVIPAKDEADRIAATVRAAAALPAVDLVVVVDDGSRDATAQVARAAGADVTRHERNRGKGAAMQTGAAYVARHEVALVGVDGASPRALLFLDADLGESAANTEPLVRPVLAGQADMTIAVLPTQRQAGGGLGFVVRLARDGIQRATGWTPTQPLSGMRCLTREAFDAALPLAHGWGVEVGLTIDLLRKGLRVVEVPCELHHRVTGRDLRAQLHRGAQYRDVWRALLARRPAVRRLLRR
jgi:glycosyltransferase involved in cell wall biosynthesis